MLNVGVIWDNSSPLLPGGESLRPKFEGKADVKHAQTNVFNETPRVTKSQRITMEHTLPESQGVGGQER